VGDGDDTMNSGVDEDDDTMKLGVSENLKKVDHNLRKGSIFGSGPITMISYVIFSNVML
jgi:hypothetical protein